MFNSREVGTVIGLLTVAAITFAVAIDYVERSSNAAFAEFMTATSSSASDQSSAPAQSDNGRTGCPQGKRKLPTQLIPLP